MNQNPTTVSRLAQGEVFEAPGLGVFVFVGPAGDFNTVDPQYDATRFFDADGNTGALTPTECEDGEHPTETLSGGLSVNSLLSPAV